MLDAGEQSAGFDTPELQLTRTPGQATGCDQGLTVRQKGDCVDDGSPGREAAAQLTIRGQEHDLMVMSGREEFAIATEGDRGDRTAGFLRHAALQRNRSRAQRAQ